MHYWAEIDSHHDTTLRTGLQEEMADLGRHQDESQSGPVEWVEERVRVRIRPARCAARFPISYRRESLEEMRVPLVDDAKPQGNREILAQQIGNEENGPVQEEEIKLPYQAEYDPRKPDPRVEVRALNEREWLEEPGVEIVEEIWRGLPNTTSRGGGRLAFRFGQGGKRQGAADPQFKIDFDIGTFGSRRRREESARSYKYHGGRHDEDLQDTG